jgi:hypothetical protein
MGVPFMGNRISYLPAKKYRHTDNFLFSYQKKRKDARGKDSIITPGSRC